MTSQAVLLRKPSILKTGQMWSWLKNPSIKAVSLCSCAVMYSAILAVYMRCFPLVRCCEASVTNLFSRSPIIQIFRLIEKGQRRREERESLASPHRFCGPPTLSRLANIRDKPSVTRYGVEQRAPCDPSCDQSLGHVRPWVCDEIHGQVFAKNNRT
ncbi:hypothetical protein F5Y19DRAFT_215213 [Xylariaceae sp. FL1651]|nr:hypothetical protein F5Y19DRAFT_215213 [Xylariaceae sp. FL1651]